MDAGYGQYSGTKGTKNQGGYTYYNEYGSSTGYTDYEETDSAGSVVTDNQASGDSGADAGGADSSGDSQPTLTKSFHRRR